MTSKNMYNDYIAGAIGGAAGLIVGHPFDTTKVQLQTQSSKTYNGTYDAIKNISKHGLTRGFFRGLGFPLASYGVINSVFFGVHGHVVHKFTDSKREASYREVAMAGAVGGLVQLGVACPVDVVKVVLQSQIPAGKQKGIGLQRGYFNGPVDCLTSVYRKHGISGCYRGALVMGMRDVPALSIYIVSYEWMNKNMMAKVKNKSNTTVALCSLTAGGLAGVLSWVLTMPLDTIKSKMQAEAATKGTVSVVECTKAALRSGGVAGLYRGMGIACIRAFPVNGVTFMVFSQAKKHLDNRHDVLFEETVSV